MNVSPARKKPARVAAARPRAAESLTIEELMRRAYVIEAEAAERYEESANALEAHNNVEVAALFRSLARIERLHSEQVLRTMGWHSAPPAPDGLGEVAPTSAEGADPGELHYLMHPYHALRLALAGEQRAQRMYERLARIAADAPVRRAAREMARDEIEHVRLIEDWLKRTPAPPEDWAIDHDPPKLID